MSPDRYEELLVDEALGSLAPVDAVELRILSVGGPQGEASSIPLTAALAARALGPGAEPLPSSARDRLLSAADRFDAARAQKPASNARTPVPGAVTTTSSAPVIVVPMGNDAPRLDLVRFAGWLIAAAAVAALLAVTIPTKRRAPAPAPATARSIVLPPTTMRPLLDDAVTVSTTEVGPRASFVWSAGGQVGHLALAGLPVLDETREVFQLWLTDAARGEDAVAAGLFSAAPTGETTVEVTPFVRVTDARELQVTRESAAGALRPTGPVVLRVALPPRR